MCNNFLSRKYVHIKISNYIYLIYLYTFSHSFDFRSKKNFREEEVFSSKIIVSEIASFVCFYYNFPYY